MNDPIYDGVGSRNPMLPEPEFLPCGHHKSLLLKSAETGLPLYCDLCDARSAQRDAEEMEAKYAAQVEALEAVVKECLELSDNWPGIAYSDDLKARCRKLVGT
jgi:hypothetical protein